MTQAIFGHAWSRRFWARVDMEPGPDACWVWAGHLNHDGYGRLWKGPRRVMAHRIAWALWHGRKPGPALDHICRNRACVRPDHLRDVTRRQNTLENSEGEAAKNAAKTHCTHGHEFTLENTMPTRQVIGGKTYYGRCCRTCHRKSTREAQRRYRSRNNG